MDCGVVHFIPNPARLYFCCTSYKTRKIWIQIGLCTFYLSLLLSKVTNSSVKRVESPALIHITL